MNIAASVRDIASPRNDFRAHRQAAPTHDLLASGTLTVGANYWASHAGLFMWRDWCPDVVDDDFRRLAATGLQMLRVFPLWPDFQPLNVLRGYHGQPVEFRHGELPLADPSGVDGSMLDRFDLLVELASRHGLDLIVGLIVGWMSGRFLAPPALEHLNAITDPVSIAWQVRFVDKFVRRFKTASAIKAWDLGNECNCMGAATKEQAWHWTATIANTIRAADPSRLVISGMHSLSVDPKGSWAIRDQAELTDILTTHPYPLFTPHCYREPLATMRPLLHATAETCLYTDLGGKPAFVEEFGTLGTMVCGENEVAAIVKVRLFDLWAHDCRGALWWCAHDQTALEKAPYDWLVVERELGLLRTNGAPKPVAQAFSEVRNAIDNLMSGALPPRRIDAVCILSPGQDNWGVAFSAFILAKQAGFDLRFHFSDQPLPKSDFYLLPSIKGFSALSREREEELWRKVEEGATLYVSFDENGFMGQWTHRSGSRIIKSSLRAESCRFSMPCGQSTAKLTLNAPVSTEVEPSEARVLAREDNGAPIFLHGQWGKGSVYSLMVPLEACLAEETGAFAPDTMQHFWEIYRQIAHEVLSNRALRKKSPWIGVTEHEDDNGNLIVVLSNYMGREISDDLDIASGYEWICALYGPEPLTVPEGILRVTLPEGGTAIWQLRRSA